MSKINVIYFNNIDSYLHHLYVGYGITSLQKVDPLLNIYNVNDNNYINISDSIIEENPRILVFFLSYNSYDLFKKFCERITLQIKLYIIVSHYVPTYIYPKLFNDNSFIDIAVIGEFDNTLPEVCNLLLNNRSVQSCQGIVYRDEDKIEITKPRDLIDNLDEIDFPYRDCFITKRLFHIFGSRGCEGHCTFCDRNALYRFQKGCKHRFRSINNILKEIDYLVEKYNCKFIAFSDSTFCSADNIIIRLKELYKGLKERNYWVQFFINLRAELITDDVIPMLTLLQKVGLGKVFVGIENFNDLTLKKFNKLATKENNLKAINNLKASKLQYDYILDIEYGFINFNPYTTINDLMYNLEQLKLYNIILNPNIITSRLIISFLTPVTKVIELDGLLLQDTSLKSITELVYADYPYDFVHNNVKAIYEILRHCYKLLNITMPDDVPFVINRYIHFYGKDELVEALKNNHFKWRSALSEFCYDFLEALINKTNMKDEAFEFAEKQCYLFLEKFKELDRDLKITKRRIVVQLMKKDELVFV